METIRGRMSLDLDFNELKNQLADYHRIALDLGTGDGRYVRVMAARNPDLFMVGLDACRENLQASSRAALRNMLFVIASASNLPDELNGLFSRITINFPWGSLLDGLLLSDQGLFSGLASVSSSNAQIEICLNAGALSEAGTTLKRGTEIISENLNQNGWSLKSSCPMDRVALTDIPTTWAKRLAYGRDPRAMRLIGKRV